MSRTKYRDLLVWQKAMDLVEDVYQATTSFPKEEMFGLTSQLRKAAVSVPSNIAEGHGRQSDRDFQRFLRIAQGSLREVETQLLLSRRLNYVDQPASSTLLESTEELGRLLNGLLKAIQRDLSQSTTR